MHLHVILSNMNWIWIEQEFCDINFSINDMKGMFRDFEYYFDCKNNTLQ